MHAATRRIECTSITVILWLKKNVAYSIEEKDSTSICLIITNDNTDNNSTWDSKKEPPRDRDIMKYFPNMSNNSYAETS